MLLENNIASFEKQKDQLKKIQFNPKKISKCALEKYARLAVMF